MGRRTRSLVVAAAGVLALVVAACAPPPPDPPPPDPPPPDPPAAVAVETWVGGLSIPWDVAFAPDGTMLLTERAVGIRVVRDGPGGGPRTVETLTNSPPDLAASGEGGMMGLALDPDFATNRRLYACFVSNEPGNGARDVRVARFTIDADYTALDERADIVTGMPVTTGRHSGCRLRFGPDGALWVGTGDAVIGTVPQDLTSLGGKVLRVDTDGAAASGNPGMPDARVHTFGHRNVQGLAFAPDGTPYAVEHGTGCDDEVNRLVGGDNYGWDPVVPPSTTYDESRPMTDLGRYAGARAAVWSSGCPTIAPSGATFLVGAQWGDWDGRLVMAVLKRSHLRVLRLAPDGDSVVGTVVALTDRGRLRTPVLGPDGALYVTTANGTNDAVLRVTRP